MKTDHSPPPTPLPSSSDPSTTQQETTPTPSEGEVSQKKETLVHALEHKIEQRPTRDSLLDHNILKADERIVAPRLHAQSEALRQAHLVYQLEHKMDMRPEKVELIGHNILKDDRLAPSLQAVGAAVEQGRLASRVEHMLERRPSPESLVEHHPMLLRDPLAESSREEKVKKVLEQQLDSRPLQQELVAHGVMHDAKVAPRLQATTESLEKQRLMHHLGHAVERRPDKGTLLSQNILKGQNDPHVLAAQHSLQQRQLLSTMERKLAERPCPQSVSALLGTETAVDYDVCTCSETSIPDHVLSEVTNEEAV